MTSATPSASTAETTGPIASSSSRQGMTAETIPVLAGAHCDSSLRKPASQTPAQPAIGARCGRPIGQKCHTKRAISGAVPDFLQALFGRVAQREILVAVQRERRDAAWQ